MQIVRRMPGVWYLDEWLWVPKQDVSEDALRAALTIYAPNGDEMVLYHETEHHFLLPRSFYGETIPAVRVVDCRPRHFPRVDIRSRLQLDHIHPELTTQHDAVDALTETGDGILQLSCGAGKTCVALHYTSIARVPTIILLETSELMRQWYEEAVRWLDVPGGIGWIGGGKFDWKGRGLVFATYHTIARRAEVLSEEFRRYFGLAVWDEGHHLAAATFSRTVTVFYGQRVVLTAQPRRRDNLHVVYLMHVGQVLYKNLHQDLITRITFWWSGVSVDVDDPEVSVRIRDTRGEIHYGLLAAYLGSIETRIRLILDLARSLLKSGRKVLILSISIQTLANLLASWVGSPQRYQFVPAPTLADIGEEDFEGTPRLLTPAEKSVLQKARNNTEPMLQVGTEADQLMAREYLAKIDRKERADKVQRKLEREHYRRKMVWVNEISDQASGAGIMIRGVGSSKRKAALRDCRLTLSIAKYGKEGLDSRPLDTVIACEPMTDPAGIQQFIGRPARSLEGKQAPRAIFVEDDLPMMVGMAHNMRQSLRNWPVDEGGPLEYDFEQNPKQTKPFRAPARTCGRGR